MSAPNIAAPSDLSPAQREQWPRLLTALWNQGYLRGDNLNELDVYRAFLRGIIPPGEDRDRLTDRIPALLLRQFKQSFTITDGQFPPLKYKPNGDEITATTAPAPPPETAPPQAPPPSGPPRVRRPRARRTGAPQGGPPSRQSGPPGRGGPPSAGDESGQPYEAMSHDDAEDSLHDVLSRDASPQDKERAVRQFQGALQAMGVDAERLASMSPQERREAFAEMGLNREQIGRANELLRHPSIQTASSTSPYRGMPGWAQRAFENT
jgi:hypothetical protein